MDLMQASSLGLFSETSKADIESICDRYAHGDCWCFALAQHQLTGWPLLQLQADGMPMHAAIRAPDGRIWDAYGLSSRDLVAARYAGSTEPDTEFQWASLNVELIYALSSPDEDDILCAADHLVLHLQLLPPGFRREVVDAAQARGVPVDALIQDVSGQAKMVPPDKARELLDELVDYYLEQGDLDALQQLSEFRLEGILAAMEHAVQGVFLGTEWRMRRSELWAAVLPESNPDAGGPVRLQYYDAHGFSGHGTHASLRVAIENLAREGYLEPDEGAMLRLQQLDSWASGMEMAERARKSWDHHEEEPSPAPGA
ncbi:hypothetical protein [Alcanivorax sp. 1008]|uniref:hypothetical protein n=1 Tax=Alcanivorax sp. 1008 TaxID=2816853 RepID=UPI001E14BD00|nr:hypothetical protein [Alcanivorax sp. 1008]MCC1496822.1 hypothetical protein [Alcanivorax sp. 1008]